MLGVTTDGNWHEFIEYMLDGFYIKARETREDLKKITNLFDEIKEQIKTGNKKLYTTDLIEAIFTYPVITPTKLVSEIGNHYTTASKHLMQLVEMGILKEAVMGKYHLFANHRLLKILSK